MPDEVRDGRSGEPQRQFPAVSTAEWQVSVPVPRGVTPEEVDAVVRYLDYLDARLSMIRGQPAVTLVVRADTLEKATHYAVERVTTLIDAQLRP